jgi:hypothetical protein
MIDSDPAVLPYMPHAVHGTPYLPMLLTLGVIGFGWWSNYRQGRTAHAVLEADKHSAQRMEDKLD